MLSASADTLHVPHKPLLICEMVKGLVFISGYRGLLTTQKFTPQPTFMQTPNDKNIW